MLEDDFSISAPSPVKVLSTSITEILVIPVQRDFASWANIIPTISQAHYFTYSDFDPESQKEVKKLLEKLG